MPGLLDQKDDIPAPQVPAKITGTTQQDIDDADNQANADNNAKIAANAAAAQAAAVAKAQADAINNHYNYGGYAGGASQAADYYQRTAAADANRPGVQINYGNANGDRANALGDREQQLSLAGLMQRRAMGLMPSIAQMQADRSNQQVAAEQSSAAASARGPAALALAQQGAAANTANAQSNISNQAQINGAQEQINNTNAAQAAYSGIRAGDYQGQGIDAQQAQAQAAQDAQQRALNDQGFASNSDRAVGINTTQLQAQGNQISTATGAQIAQNQLNQQASQHSDDRTDKYIGYAVGGAAGLGGALLAAGLGGGSGGSASPGGVTNPSAGGSQPTPQPGAPAGFDPATGAPVPSQGGGYDPTKPDSDERAKIPATWGDGSARGAEAAPSTWGGGPGTSPVDISAQIARRALEEQSARESQANPQPQQGMHSTGPQAVAGMEALRRRDAEDYGLILAKERNGAPLTEREQATKFALRRRVANDDAGMRAHPQAPMAAQHGSPLARGVGNELSNMGRALMQDGGGSTHYAPVSFNPQQQQLTGPRHMDSDMTSKQPAAMPAVGGTAPAGSPDAALVAAQARLIAQQNANQAMLAMGPSVGGPRPVAPLPPPVANMPAQQQAQLAQPPAVQGAIDRANPPYQGPMDSDDRTKLAAAWDQGREAGQRQIIHAQNEAAGRSMEAARAGEAERLAATRVRLEEWKPDVLDRARHYVADTADDITRPGPVGKALARAIGRRAEGDEGPPPQGPNTPAMPANMYPDEPAPRGREPVSFSRGASTVDTPLTPSEEEQYAKWKQQYAPRDSGGDYDLRGAFKAGIKPDPQSGHWPDTYKKPNHPTFSDESQYAKQGSPGHWEGETFTPPPQQGSLNVPAWSMAETLRRSRGMMSDERTKNVGGLSSALSRGDDGRVNTPMANASRALEAEPYTYKPEFAARNGQQVGEKNVGPMAQNMARDPVARTAVGVSQDTGTLNLDPHKTLKVVAGTVAEQQRQNDEQDRKISLMARRLGLR